VPDRRVVAQLEHHPSLDRLDVGQARLDLEGVAACPVIDRGIPRALIIATEERHLDLEARSNGKALAKPFEYA